MGGCADEDYAMGLHDDTHAHYPHTMMGSGVCRPEISDMQLLEANTCVAGGWLASRHADDISVEQLSSYSGPHLHTKDKVCDKFTHLPHDIQVQVIQFNHGGEFISAKFSSLL